jgi:tagatose 1,6-diphosphate aldolase
MIRKPAGSLVPREMLSAGVDFPDYKKQVEMAMEARASGILGGRAFWKEFFLQDGPAAREKFARGEAVERVKQCDAIVRARATPWFKPCGLATDDLRKHARRRGLAFSLRRQGRGAG